MVHGVSSKTSSTPLTLEELFGGHKSFSRAFKDAGITSLVQVMLLPREALRELHGITATSAVMISKTLEQHGLKHRALNQKASEFLIEQFGCVEDAPIGALQVVTMRNGQVNRPVFAPLESIKVLEITDPEMTIVKIIYKSRSGLRSMMRSLINDGVQIHDLNEDIRHINSRLSYYDLGFSPVELPLPIGDEELGIVPPVRGHLHSVS